MFRRITFFFWLLAAMPVWAGNPVDELLSTLPAVEAERAYSAGDRRHIVIPACEGEGGEVVPGWPVEFASDARIAEVQAALKHGRRPVSCEDIGMDAGSRIFFRLLRHAGVYNQTLLRLEGKPVGAVYDPGDCPQTTR